METITLSGYTEEIPLLQASPDQFLRAAQDVLLQLQWSIGALDENTLVAQTPPSILSRGEIITISITGHTAQVKVMPVNEYYWDQQQSRDIVARFRDTVGLIGSAQQKEERSRHPMHREKYGALIPSRTYLLTPLLVYSIVLVFLLMALSGVSVLDPTAKSLFAWGGNSGIAVVEGQWWRLITYMFLHAGPLHLLMNTYALLYIGMFLEPLLGRLRLIAAYLLTGIGAGLLSITMHPYSVGVGASGALFGLYGVFFALLTTSYLQKTAKRTMLRSILFFIVFNLLMGLQGNTDNAAHIGGLVSGILAGYAFYPGVKSNAPVKAVLLTISGLSLSVLLLIVLLVTQLKR